MQRFWRNLCQRIQASARGAIRRGDVHLRAVFSRQNLGVRSFQVRGDVRVISHGQVSDGSGLGELDPGDAGIGKRCEHLKVGLHQLIQAV